jgi:hypothetical protein
VGHILITTIEFSVASACRVQVHGHIDVVALSLHYTQVHWQRRGLVTQVHFLGQFKRETGKVGLAIQQGADVLPCSASEKKESMRK